MASGVNDSIFISMCTKKTGVTEMSQKFVQRCKTVEFHKMNGIATNIDHEGWKSNIENCTIAMVARY